MNTTNSDHEFDFLLVRIVTQCWSTRDQQMHTWTGIYTLTLTHRPGADRCLARPRCALPLSTQSTRHWLRLVRVSHCVIVSSVRILFPSASYCAELDRLVELKSNKLTSTTLNNNLTMKYGTRGPEWQRVQHFFHFHKFASDPNAHIQTLPNCYVLQRDVLTVVIFH